MGIRVTVLIDDEIMAKLRKQKINFSETIFSPTGIRAAAGIETIKKLLIDY